ncbi:MAG: alpha/beta fold hydrolase, partial [Anaerolineae bacterium]|nr:alpha/beta fold hydrolase [Anaerolineae bacterium]
MSKHKKANPIVSVVGGLATAALTAAGGWILYSATKINHNLKLPYAIHSDRKTIADKKAGILSYYVDQQVGGRPLLLVHSINAAASAYELHPLFRHYRKLRPVYALDLPGFGYSERSQREYTPQLYTEAILAMLEEIGEPADVVALSLGCEFCARAALAQPQAINSLTCISPSGMSYRPGRTSQDVSRSGASDKLYRAFTFPLWSQALFDLIATRRSIEFFLKQSFAGPVDQGLMDYAYITAHQVGAKQAPLTFVSGKLFTPDILDKVYMRLPMPG